MGSLLKGLALVALIALGMNPQKTDAMSLTGAYKWLSKERSRAELEAAANAIVETVQQYKPPSMSAIAVEEIAGALEWYTETKPEVLLLPKKTYTLSDYTYSDKVGDLKNDEVVILEKIHPEEDEDTPEMYELMKVSDQSGASAGRTFLVPTTNVKLACAGETCSFPSTTGKGRRRKTLRRRK